MTETLDRPRTKDPVPLTVYRVMANVVGVGLVLLFASLPYRYWTSTYHKEPTAAIARVGLSRSVRVVVRGAAAWTALT